MGCVRRVIIRTLHFTLWPPELKQRICIVTPSALGSNPRVVKEADALHGAGYDVHVLSTRTHGDADRRDAAILSRAPWTSKRIDLRGSLSYRSLRAVQLAAAHLPGITSTSSVVAALGHSPFFLPLAYAAIRIKADLFIAHYPAGLAVAAWAARYQRACYAYDAEDYHSGDLPEHPEYQQEKKSIERIEGTYFPGAAYVTAASPMIAEAYAQRYTGPPATVVHNVFPLAHAPLVASHQGWVMPRPTFYWFSQTIGPERGLECAVRALALTRSRVHLHLRGTPLPQYLQVLLDLAKRLGVFERIHFHPPAEPDDMVRLANMYDIGLVAEPGQTPARRVGLTNKLFTYVLAGIPCVASNIPSHRAIAGQFGDAMTLYGANDPAALAQAVDAYAADVARLRSVRRAAYRLGQERFNWECERGKLLDCVRLALEAAGNTERSVRIARMPAGDAVA